jgi:hypothetical protein
MVVPSGKVPGMAVWRERLFATMHLNANLPAAYFGVPPSRSSRSVSKSRSDHTKTGHGTGLGARFHEARFGPHATLRQRARDSTRPARVEPAGSLPVGRTR